MLMVLLRHLLELLLLSAALFVTSAMVLMTWLLVPGWRRADMWVRYWHVVFCATCIGTAGLLLGWWWELAR